MTHRQKRIIRNRAKAVAYLVDNPRASAYDVSRASGMSLPAVKKLIANRQTPPEVFEHTTGTWRKATSNEMAVFNLSTEYASPGTKLLDTAIDTFKQRGTEYGDAGESAATIAALWTAISGKDITPSMAVRMLIGLKLARLKANPHHQDSIVDIAGYAAVLADAVAKEQG